MSKGIVHAAGYLLVVEKLILNASPLEEYTCWSSKQLGCSCISWGQWACGFCNGGRSMEAPLVAPASKPYKRSAAALVRPAV